MENGAPPLKRHCTSDILPSTTNPWANWISQQVTSTLIVFEVPITHSASDVYSLFSHHGEVKAVERSADGLATLIMMSDTTATSRCMQISTIDGLTMGSQRLLIKYCSQRLLYGSDLLRYAKVVRLQITDVIYPITVDLLYSNCLPFTTSPPLRIQIGPKKMDNVVEALIEFASANDVNEIIQALNGRDLYPGSANLLLNPSGLPCILIGRQYIRARDFTIQPFNNNNQIIEQQQRSNHQISTNSFNINNPLLNTMLASFLHPAMAAAVANTTSIGEIVYDSFISNTSALPPSSTTIPTLSSSSSSSNNNNAIVTAGISINNNNNSNNSRSSLGNNNHHLHPHSQSHSHHHHHNSSSSSSSIIIANNLCEFIESEGCVVYFNHLPEQLLNCDRLFNLVSLYGNVVRIKFILSRDGVAMVQMSSPQAGEYLLMHLNRLNVFDCIITVIACKHTNIAESGTVPIMKDGSLSLKNFSANQNNRFLAPASTTRTRIMPPTSTLHFFNAPPNLDEEAIRKIIIDNKGHDPHKLAIFPPKAGQSGSLGLMEWSTVREAVETLIMANNVVLHPDCAPHPYHLKLAFSSKPIRENRC